MGRGRKDKKVSDDIKWLGEDDSFCSADKVSAVSLNVTGMHSNISAVLLNVF